ncbi:alkylmercury lyase MerB [Dictyobacter aurantiacus]|uniref:Alkylmercury (Organomercurial) lyase MerB n=1 Tax=Dictyobacter aurantiacus TaxID=1936993 RepID=A0A401ZEL1_9CHLR|nr:alkylmercury lyase MerB [Dictyobacter aurantiacus]GCE05314.1 alkylmercury (organomercurial) lyase MerB [Dictyobacter aurantiacus]
MQGISDVALIDALTERLRASCRGYTKLWLELLRLLGQGSAVEPGRLAEVMGMTEEALLEQLKELPKIEYNASGQVVAAGISLLPTKHHFLVQGHELFTWCAFDSLAYPVILQQPVQVASSCPITNEIIRLRVTPDGLKDVEPEGAYIAIALPSANEMCSDIRTSFCNQTHFFTSEQAARQWVQTHTNAVPLPVGEAYQIVRQVAWQVYFAQAI